MAKMSEPARTSTTSWSPTWPSKMAPEKSPKLTPLERSGPAGAACLAAMSSSPAPFSLFRRFCPPPGRFLPRQKGSCGAARCKRRKTWLSRQRRLHQTARLGKIHLSRVFALEHADHLAHVLDAGRTGLGYDGGDRLLHVVF